ncbi:MAG: gamma carbonic anhydrase family protein [Gammaproteobacteria bacterium]|nr:gamma carbonic anhydrase family protein [Gammaproteobacteria bacterium]
MSIRSFEGNAPEIDSTAFVDESAVVIGRVKLAAEVSIWPLVVIRGDVNFIEVGARSNVQDGTIVHCTSPTADLPDGYATIIGDDVTVGHQAIIHGCTIGHHCLIGMGATLMDGAVIEPYTIIGAGALVPPGKQLGSGLWVGAPAKRVRDLTDDERSMLGSHARHYVKLHHRHSGRT